MFNKGHTSYYCKPMSQRSHLLPFQLEDSEDDSYMCSPQVENCNVKYGFHTPDSVGSNIHTPDSEAWTPGFSEEVDYFIPYIRNVPSPADSTLPQTACAFQDDCDNFIAKKVKEESGSNKLNDCNCYLETPKKFKALRRDTRRKYRYQPFSPNTKKVDIVSPIALEALHLEENEASESSDCFLKSVLCDEVDKKTCKASIEFTPNLSPIKEESELLHQGKRSHLEHLQVTPSKKRKTDSPKKIRSPFKKLLQDKENSPWKFNSSRNLHQSSSGVFFLNKPVKNISCVFKAINFKSSSTVYFDNDRLDFMTLLGKKSNHLSIVSKIFSYLPASDLKSVTEVSQTWKMLCLSDRASYKRLKKYNADSKSFKENHFKDTVVLSLQNTNESTPKKMRVLSTWKENCNLTSFKETPGSPPVSPSRAKFHLYLKAARKLDKSGKLVPCPKCTSPSNVNEEEAHGSCTKCSFQFCLRCHCPFHSGKSCKYFITSSPSSSPSKVSRTKVGSVKSRKALRRL